MSRHRPKRMVRVELTWQQILSLLEPQLPKDVTLHSTRVKDSFEYGQELLCLKLESDEFDTVPEATLIPELHLKFEK